MTARSARRKPRAPGTLVPATVAPMTLAPTLAPMLAPRSSAPCAAGSCAAPVPALAFRALAFRALPVPVLCGAPFARRAAKSPEGTFRESRAGPMGGTVERSHEAAPSPRRSVEDVGPPNAPSPERAVTRTLLPPNRWATMAPSHRATETPSHHGSEPPHGWPPDARTTEPRNSEGPKPAPAPSLYQQHLVSTAPQGTLTTGSNSRCRPCQRRSDVWGSPSASYSTRA